MDVKRPSSCRGSPAAIVCLQKIKCLKGSCICRFRSLKCSDLCSCNDCENSNVSADTSEDESDEESESDNEDDDELICTFFRLKESAISFSIYRYIMFHFKILHAV